MTEEREKVSPEEDYRRFHEAIKLRVVRHFGPKYPGLRLADVRVRDSGMITVQVKLSGVPYGSFCTLDDHSLQLLVQYPPEKLADMVFRRLMFIREDPESKLTAEDVRNAVCSTQPLTRPIVDYPTTPLSGDP